MCVHTYILHKVRKGTMTQEEYNKRDEDAGTKISSEIDVPWEHKGGSFVRRGSAREEGGREKWCVNKYKVQWYICMKMS